MKRSTLTLLLISLCTVPTIAQQGPAPRIALVDSIFSLSSWYERVPEEYRNYRGLVIEEVPAVDYYQVVPRIFFDSASAVIPSRYVQFVRYEQTLGFDERKIEGGVMERYYNVLNIIGARLRRDDSLRYTIEGASFRDLVPTEVGGGDSTPLAAARGQAVYDYLVNVWHVSKSQLELLPRRDHPEFIYNPYTPGGIAMNRRVDLRPRKKALLAPVIDSTTMSAFVPATAWLRVDPVDTSYNFLDQFVEVRRNGREWNRMMLPQGRSTHIHVDWRSSLGEPPGDGDTLTMQYIVRKWGGDEVRSNIIEIPVIGIARDRAREQFRSRRTIVSAFVWDAYEEGHPGNRAAEFLLKEYLAPALRPGSSVTVLLSNPERQMQEREMRLKEGWGRHVIQVLGKAKPKLQPMTAIITRLHGGEPVLFDTTLTEGRMFDIYLARVLITNPR